MSRRLLVGHYPGILMKCGTVHKRGVSGWKHGREGTTLSLSPRSPSLNGARRDEGYPRVRACRARRFSRRQIDAISSWRSVFTAWMQPHASRGVIRLPER